MASSLDTSDNSTRGSQLAAALAKQIARGEWPVGSLMPTTRQLASQFGVSRKTVQAALRILESRNAVETKHRQGCVVRSTGALVVMKKNQVGIVVRPAANSVDESDQFSSHGNENWGTTIAAGAEDDLLAAGKLMAIIPFRASDKDPLGSFLERLDRVRGSLAGLICFPVVPPTTSPLEFLRAMDERQLPYVIINRFSDSLLHNFVGVDFVAGSRLIGRCLAKMGLHQTLLLGTPPTLSQSVMDRISGLYQGYISEGAPTRDIAFVKCTGADHASGYEQMKRHLSDHQPPQVVVATGDLLAFGAIQALQERGLRVPEDVGVIGGTGLMPRSGSLALTTLAQPMLEIGRCAAQMLLEMERADTTRMTGRIVQGELIVRESMIIPESVQKELSHAETMWEFRSER